MYTNLFMNTKRKLTEKDINEFQTKNKIAMPQEIKSHYLEYNGGYPEKTVFRAKNGQEYEVNYFLSISCGEGLALEKTLILLDDETAFPKWLVPFANDEGGNLFCYSIRTGEEGAIYYYDHEFEYGENPEENVILLSTSIINFINSLEENEDEE